MLLGSLNGPVHDLSDYYLFSVHMVQHLLLTLVFPPLLILGLPGLAGRARCVRPASVRRVARVLTHPVAAAAIFTVTIAVWHLSPYYDLMMRDHDVHIVTHLMFMVTATLHVVAGDEPGARRPAAARATALACSTCFWWAFRCRSSPR